LRKFWTYHLLFTPYFHRRFARNVMNLLLVHTITKLAVGSSIRGAKTGVRSTFSPQNLVLAVFFVAYRRSPQAYVLGASVKKNNIYIFVVDLVAHF
jgi:hypothetical protein